MRIDVLTIFPEIFETPLSYSIPNRAVEKGALNIDIHDIRNFANDKHNRVDDYPYGGGPGMIMKPGPIVRAVDNIDRDHFKILLTPKGERLNQKILKELSEKDKIMLICGRYEGIDNRVNQMVVDREISIGDYVLSGGEIPSMVLIDGISRLLPDVLGNQNSKKEESFENDFLEYPQYTRPRKFRGLEVPEILLSGDHKKIKEWRQIKSKNITEKRRPDLNNNIYLGLVHYPVYDKSGEIVSSSITPIDIHDISRTCKTYNLKKYVIVSPLPKQNAIVKEMLNYWEEGYGKEFNENRKEALSLVSVEENIDSLIKRVETIENKKPEIWVTSARFEKDYISYEQAQKRIVKKDDIPIIILFGTGWGLTEDVIDRADIKLEPVKIAGSNYNHLSVRSAVSIIIDRLLGNRR